MRELLVILFSGIFTSTILSSDFGDSEENLRNFPPEIQQIGNQSVTEDQTFIYNVIVSDDDDDTIQYFLNIDGNGNESINQQGLLTIVPNLNFNGIIQVEVTVSDGTETDSEIFNLEPPLHEINNDLDPDIYTANQLPFSKLLKSYNLKPMSLKNLFSWVVAEWNVPALAQPEEAKIASFPYSVRMRSISAPTKSSAVSHETATNGSTPRFAVSLRCPFSSQPLRIIGRGTRHRA